MTKRSGDARYFLVPLLRRHPHRRRTLGVSSNGLISIGPDRRKHEQPSRAAAHARLGEPKIAALWADLNPSTRPRHRLHEQLQRRRRPGDRQGRVHLELGILRLRNERLPAGPSSRSSSSTPAASSSATTASSPTRRSTTTAVGSVVMPVIAQGGFVAPAGFVPPPAGVDFSEMVPFTGGSLIFENFDSRPVHFDLDQNDLIFTPGAGGYRCDQRAALRQAGRSRSGGERHRQEGSEGEDQGRQAEAREGALEGPQAPAQLQRGVLRRSLRLAQVAEAQEGRQRLRRTPSPARAP